ncbi:MAG: hypothetical protein GX575_26110 [Candidatus Anammoximicrobium sp.]|nr:hypothetical protein [Candidatus Anammoximicrobium sp.]
MPTHNAFAHQRYSAEPPTARWTLLRASEPPGPNSADYERTTALVGEAYRVAGVRAIWLVHGTFVGDDTTGLIRLVERLAPAASQRLRPIHKWVADRVAQDVGNYSAQYAAEFARGVQIPVERVVWSGENHHLARADAAVGLIDRLQAASFGPEDRVLIWGHSHAGNVLALVSNLLTANDAERESFFAAARTFYQRRWGNRIAQPAWQRVRESLDSPSVCRSWPQLDMVTFGTPIRYGWDTQGYAKLLHFVYHRPRPGVPEHLTSLPRTVADVLHTADGDYVHQFGIAGSDLPPVCSGLRSWLANRRLGRLLQPGLRRRDLLKRLRVGQRIPQEGETLLVEYPDGPATRQLAGHAVYTRQFWLPFHALEVARRFYLVRDRK